jgi:hypothetical protein
MSSPSQFSRIFGLMKTALRALAALLCGTFSLWMGIYGMPLSALFGLAITAGTFTCLRRRIGTKWVLIAWLSVPLVIWQVALPEYAVETRRLACVASAAAGTPYPMCETVSYRPPDPKESGSVFTLREKLAASGFNAVLAPGGLMTGHSEVAWETLQLMRTPSPMLNPTGRPIGERRGLCQHGAASKGTTYTWQSDFFLDSAFFRQTVAGLAKRARTAGPSAGPVSAALPLGGRGNNQVYFSKGQAVTLRTVLALYVPGPQLTARRAESGALTVTWSGPIRYPPRAAFRFPLWTVHGTYDVRVDEAIFCGLQMDGWMGPYRQEWTATIDPNDSRLQDPKVRQSNPTGLEALVRALTSG